MPHAHPEIGQLSDFALGRLESDQLDAVESHLASCETCCDLLKQMKEDTFVGLVRGAKQPSPESAGSPSEVGEVTQDDGDRAPVAAPTPLADALTQDGSGVNVPVAGPDSATQAPLPAGAVVADIPAALAEHSRYRIVELLGTGGMGSVYRAEHRLMQRHVALKVIHPKFVQSKQAVDRFRREVQAAGRLVHANIVHSYDAEQAGDVHFLVMEYVKGTDLQKVLEERGPLPVPEACEYIRQAALGLQHAHENGMVHRDIKPQNLMLSGVDEAARFVGSRGRSEPLRLRTGAVKILDFGLASLTALTDAGEETADDQPSEIENQKSALTQAGSLMGTPDYMAPEQAKDARTADIRSDIYSLGCTLYALLTGKVPFPGGTAIDKVIAHSTNQPKPIAELRKDTPAALVKLLDKMMAKDPAARYQTPAEVAAALAPLFDAAGSPRTGGRGRSRRRTLVALGAIAAGLLLVAAGIIFYIQTADGVVRFEINDPEIKVVVGTDRIIVTGADPKPIRLKPGKHRLTITRGEDFTFETTMLELTRGGKTRLKIEWLDTALVVRQDGLFIGQKPRPPDERAILAKIDAAHKSAEVWLTLFDQGKYGEAWELQARVVKQMLTKEAAERTYQQVLQQIGKNKTRILFKREHSNNPPGMLPGNYVVVQYASRFEKLKESMESVVLTLEGDGQWRAINYSAINWPHPGEFPGGFAWPLAPKAEVVNTFGLGIRPIAKDGVTLDDKSWKLKSAGSKTFELYEIPPIAEDCMLVCRAKMKSALPLGRAFLEMWCIDKGEKYFSKGINRPLVGTTDWNTYEIPFFLKHGEQPEKVRINVVIEGGGTVWIKDVELRKAALPKGFGQSPLDGTWKPVAIEQNGQAVPEEALKKIDFPTEFVFKGNRWGAISRSGKRYESAFVLDASKNPAWIDVKGSLFEGMPDLHGILKLEGDTITVCVVEKDRPRPTEFKTKAQTGQMLIVARRVQEPAWMPLFNGKDLDGWKPPLKSVWTVEDGALVGRDVGLMLTSAREFAGSFHLRCEVKVSDKSFSHVKVRLDPAKGTGYGLPIRGPYWIHGVNKIITPAQTPRPPVDSWFVYEIIANGPEIVVKIDGRVLAHLHDTTVRRGHIALHTMSLGTVQFRKIEIKELPMTTAAPLVQAKADEDLIQGTWRPIAGEYAGRKLTGDELKGTRAVFKDETLTLTLRMGKEFLRMTGPFSLDARKDPKRITFIIQQTPKDQKGAASNTGVHGIYRFDGDRLVLCITEGADRRPTEVPVYRRANLRCGAPLALAGTIRMHL